MTLDTILKFAIKAAITLATGAIVLVAIKTEKEAKAAVDAHFEPAPKPMLELVK